MLDPQPRLPLAERVAAWWRGVAPAIGARVRAWFWPAAAAILTLILIAVVVRPFADTPDPTADDVAAAWNESIARLGILPVFPPEEDLHVGDVWAVVADAEETPLLGKAVRVAHIDMRDEINKAADRQPVFSDTAELKPSEKIRRQDRKEVEIKAADSRIALTLAAFPGISINHARRASGALGATFGGLGAGREDQTLEEIRIPTVETYGVPAPAAFFKFDDWCNDAKTKIYCSDALVRRVIAYAVSDRVLATREGRYLARLELRFVTRVFLTREIEHRRRQNNAGGALLRISSEPAKPQPAPAPGAAGDAAAQTGAAVNQVATGIENAASGTSPSATNALYRGDGTEIALREVFQRPVAFGYRAITIALPPSTPAAETTP